MFIKVMGSIISTLSLLDKADEATACIFFHFSGQLSWKESALATKFKISLNLLGHQDNNFDQR